MLNPHRKITASNERRRRRTIGVTRTVGVTWTVGVTLLLALLSTAAADAAEPVTPAAAIDALAAQKSYVQVRAFRLGGRYGEGDGAALAQGGEGGTTLESLGAPPLEVGLITLGTAKRDGAGRIVNAVVIFPDEWGDATTSYRRWVEGEAADGERYPPPVAAGGLIDPARFFVVLVDAIGLFGTAKPSSGLGPRFPRYSLEDTAAAALSALFDRLDVGRIRLATGVSFGGSVAWLAAAMAPERIDAALPLAASPGGDDPVAAWTFALMAAAITADPAWRQRDGQYYALPEAEWPRRGVMFGFSVFELFSGGLDGSVPADRARDSVFQWERAPQPLAARAAPYDAVDLLWRSEALRAFTLEPWLGRVSQPLLAVHAAGDALFVPARTAAAVRRIPSAEMIVVARDRVRGRDPLPVLASLVNDATFAAFFERAGLGDDGQSRLAEINVTAPAVAAAASPDASFWRTRITWPFPPRTSEVKDGLGRVWELGYVDVGEAAGEPLLWLSDRGFTHAVFAPSIAFAARRGVRVLAPDLPPYGLSAAGNVGRPANRSVEDLRALLADWLRQGLGFKRVNCLGQGLGAELCAQLALSEPGLIGRLILIVPPAFVGPSAPAGDAAQGGDEASALIAAEMARPPQEITERLLGRGQGSAAADPAGTVGAAGAGEALFARESAAARFFADLRLGLATASRQELEDYATAFVIDGAGRDRLTGDLPTLAARLQKANIPLMLAVGGRGRGVSEVAASLAALAERAVGAATPPVIRIYPAAGAVVPVDAPVAFGRDLVDFLAGRPVVVMTADVILRLLAGEPPHRAATGAGR